MNDQDVSTDKPMALVVDDSVVMRNVLTKTLTNLGFDVRQARNGREALQCVGREHGRFRVLLVDWNMPEMDGFELLSTIRADPANASVAVIMVTTESDPEDMARALRAGANEYVMKPFTPEIIIGKLQLAGVDLPGVEATK